MSYKEQLERDRILAACALPVPQAPTPEPDSDTAAFLDSVKATLLHREGIHGDPSIGLRAAGKAITGLIEYYYGISLPENLPPHIVAAIQQIFKIMRGAGDAYHEDNYVDQIGYALLARRTDGRRKP